MADTLPPFVPDQPETESNLASEVVRKNLNSLGTTNYTTNPSYPLTPRTGMTRLYDDAGAGTNIKLQWFHNGSWRTLVEHMELYITLARRREIPVAVAAVSWVINHNLGVKPLVQCFDSANNQLVPANVQHVQVAGQWMRVVVTHTAAIAGYVILVG